MMIVVALFDGGGGCFRRTTKESLKTLQVSLLAFLSFFFFCETKEKKRRGEGLSSCADERERKKNGGVLGLEKERAKKG